MWNYIDKLVGIKTSNIINYQFSLKINCSESGNFIAETIEKIEICCFNGVPANCYTDEQLDSLFDNITLCCNVIKTNQGLHVSNIIFKNESNEVILPKF